MTTLLKTFDSYVGPKHFILVEMDEQIVLVQLESNNIFELVSNKNIARLLFHKTNEASERNLLRKNHLCIIIVSLITHIY